MRTAHPRSNTLPIRVLLTLWLAWGLAGCASFDGTLDHSRTLGDERHRVRIGDIRSVAVAPLLKRGSVEPMARRLEMRLHRSLRRALPEARVVAPNLLEKTLAEKPGALERFTRWHSAYARSAKFNPSMVRQYRILAGVDYLLLVRKARFDRKRLPGADAVERCPFVFCMGPRPHHIWRTDLEVVVDLIDLRRGKIVWRGVGSAQNDYASDREIAFLKEDLEQKPPAELESVDDDLMLVASDGVARQIARYSTGD